MNKKNFLLIAISSLVATYSFAAEPCKAYVRLDLGYGLSSGTKAYGTQFEDNNGTLVKSESYSSLDQDERGMIGDLAVGYAFNDAMRAEVSFDFKPKMLAYGQTYKVETQQLGGSARLLYDFNNNTPVTPFVFGGLGAIDIKPTIKPFITSDLSGDGKPYITKILDTPGQEGQLEKDDSNKIATYSALNMPSKTVMTYQAGFGLAFKASEQVAIDFIYGLGGKTNYQVLVNTGTFAIKEDQEITEANAGASVERFKQLQFKNQLDQSFTLGVRFTM